MPTSYSSFNHLSSERGFIIAPFTPNEESPIIILQPDVVRQYPWSEVEAISKMPFYLEGIDKPLDSTSREVYHNDFSRFHRAFSAIGFQKLVLSRCADIGHQGTNPGRLFSQACELYPEAFVTLFSAPQCGTWLVATPEVLLAREGERWRTMALAGTMPYSDDMPQWSEKNIQEQAYVSQYINDCLNHFSHDVCVKGPYTTRAASLAHLRTDFTFTLADDARVGDILADLHPTPAVCGLPKQEAHRFILENETCDRSYYSGFSGPMNMNGDTSLFVSLRCMRILSDRYRLYAGGGILPQSEETMEWNETAAKMQAMQSLIE